LIKRLETAAASGDSSRVLELLLREDTNPNTAWQAELGGHKFACTALHFAAKEGYEDVVTFLLGRKADPNGGAGQRSPGVVGGNTLSPLHLALRSNHVAIAMHLVAAGADINSSDPVGCSSLALARLIDHELHRDPGVGVTVARS